MARWLRQLPSTPVLAYIGAMGVGTMFVIDETLDLRRWKVVRHTVAPPGAEPFSLRLNARTRADPIGQTSWPAGRVLLEVLLQDGAQRDEGAVLELGSGIGTTAIGLALAAAHERSAGRPSATVVATDACCMCIENCMRNALAHSLPVRVAGSECAQAVLMDGAPAGATSDATAAAAPSGASRFRVGLWDAAAEHAAAHLPVPLGEAPRIRMALASRRAAFTWHSQHTAHSHTHHRCRRRVCLASPEQISHLIGADVVYHGGAGGAPEGRGGLARTLGALLRAKPSMQARARVALGRSLGAWLGARLGACRLGSHQVTLLLVDRFSGGAVAAVSNVAGVQQASGGSEEVTAAWVDLVCRDSRAWAQRSTTFDASLVDFEAACAAQARVWNLGERRCG